MMIKNLLENFLGIVGTVGGIALLVLLCWMSGVVFMDWVEEVVKKDDVDAVFEAARSFVSRIAQECEDPEGTVDMTKFIARLNETTESLRDAIAQMEEHERSEEPSSTRGHPKTAGG